MLHYNTITQNTLRIVKQLMDDPELQNFILVGGTALALQIGHRISIDIDLFTSKNFDTYSLQEHLKHTYNFETDFLAENTIKGEIQNVKVDCIRHGYPLIDKSLVLDKIRIASLIEIAAMKINAITTNGTRIKDFIDIAYLSEFLSLNQILEAYQKKYKNNVVMALKSLLYFNDINTNEPIHMVNSSNKFEWENIKNRIILMQDFPEKTLGALS